MAPYQLRYIITLIQSPTQGRRKGGGVGGGGSDTPPPFVFVGGGANLIHFLYKVLGKRSVQK